MRITSVDTFVTKNYNCQNSIQIKFEFDKFERLTSRF